MIRLLPRNIFRAYDIRGKYNDDLTPEGMARIGVVFGNIVSRETGLESPKVAVGHDIRTSSETLAHAFNSGLMSTGARVEFIGKGSFGHALFHGWNRDFTAVAFITASHLPPEWNGVKFYWGDGEGFSEELNAEIGDIACGLSKGTDEAPTIKRAKWDFVGSIGGANSKEEYELFMLGAFEITSGMKVVLDCGGGATTLSAPDLFKRIGFDVIHSFTEPDPTFSGRPSEPTPETLAIASKLVKENDGVSFGVGFDGDGDRAIILDEKGEVLSTERLGILFAKYGLKKKKGVVLANVECSMAIEDVLVPLGFDVRRIKVGHTFLIAGAKETDAVLGIESSGHLVVPRYFLFDDAMLTPLLTAEILRATGKPLSELMADIPNYPMQKRVVKCSDDTKFEVVVKLTEWAKSEYEVNDIDGARVSTENAWVLVRASNTAAKIRITVEGRTASAANELADRFEEKLRGFID